jgi:hypothetical protein
MFQSSFVPAKQVYLELCAFSFVMYSFEPAGMALWRYQGALVSSQRRFLASHVIAAAYIFQGLDQS